MIYSIFKDKVTRFPDQPGFVLEDGRRLGYAEAGLLVDSLAEHLVALGVKQGDRVAVMLNFESLHPFMLYALDKLNASYLPFDVNMPEAQLEADLEKLNPSLFVSPSLRGAAGNDPRHCERSEAIQEKQILDCFVGVPPRNDEISVPPRNDEISVPPRNDEIPVYLVASSGTSGNKKWMGIKGAGLGYWEKTEEIQLNLKPGHKVLCTRSPGYDARISEYLRALIAGGELHLISRDQRRDLDYIVNYCKENKITEILLIASQLTVDNIESIIQQLAEGGLKNLIVTGDACRPKLQALCEKYGISLVNAYGPTEACFGVSLMIVNGMNLLDENGQHVVPISLPKGDEIILHLVEGRVYIESPYLITEYIDNPEATAKNIKIININGRTVKVFDTGDRADLVDGKLRLKGRDDNSDDCKINGIKVDKQDSENKLIRYASIDPAFVNAVVVSKSVNGNTRLVAYLVVKPGFDANKLNERLISQLLPEQIPILLTLPQLPVMAVSGKIDKQSLMHRQDHAEEYLLSTSLQSKSSIEKFDDPLIIQLRLIWKRILGVERDSNDEGFDELGGDSSGLTRLVGIIKRDLNSTITKLDLLRLGRITINSIYGLLADQVEVKQGPVMAIINPLSKVIDPKNNNLYLLPHLLGEGFFSYKHLAESILENRTDINIYGLTDPGIHDDNLIDKTFDQMIDQYVEVIIKKEAESPKRYPPLIYLAGFSYGCFLAYQVALRLTARGFNVGELHLIDGFPPLYFHFLTKDEHAILMLNFYRFIGEVLNGELYCEAIDTTKEIMLVGLDKLTQIDSIFSELFSQALGDSSHRMLRIAKQHLIYMLKNKREQIATIRDTRLYFSNPDQDFFKVLSKIHDISYENQTKTYGLWDMYLLNITRVSSIASSNHLDLIRKKANSSMFFAYKRYQGDIYKPFVDSHALKPIVFTGDCDNGTTNITVCHLSLAKAQDLIKRATSFEHLGVQFYSNFPCLLKNSVSPYNADIKSISEQAITLNVENQLAETVLNDIVVDTLDDDYEFVKNFSLMESCQNVLQSEVKIRFTATIHYYIENTKIVDTVYRCYGDPGQLKALLSSAKLPANARIQLTGKKLQVSFFAYHDELPFKKMELVNTLIKEVTPLIFPFVMCTPDVDVKPVIDDFFSACKRFESRSLIPSQ